MEEEDDWMDESELSSSDDFVIGNGRKGRKGKKGKKSAKGKGAKGKKGKGGGGGGGGTLDGFDLDELVAS